MTLATRCPQCGTTFRVVSDQLKLRKGLVKCGKCLHVFNGVEFLHYFSEAAPAAAPSAATPRTSAPEPEFLGAGDTHGAIPTRAPVTRAPLEPTSDAPASPGFTEPAPASVAAHFASGAAVPPADVARAPVMRDVPFSTIGFDETSIEPARTFSPPEEAAPMSGGTAAPSPAEPASAFAPTSAPAEPQPVRIAAPETDIAAGATSPAGASSQPAQIAAPDASVPMAETPTRTTMDSSAWAARTEPRFAPQPESPVFDVHPGEASAAATAPLADTAEPAFVEPASIEPALAEPSIAEPVIVEPAAVEIESAELESVASELTDSAAAEPQAAETDSATAEPQAPETETAAAEEARAEIRALEAAVHANTAAPRAADDASALAPLTLLDIARQGPAAGEAPRIDAFEELPAFLRDKRRAPRWVRALVACTSVVALAGIAAQAAYVYRAELAAYLPEARAPLETACAWLPEPARCSVDLPRHITQLRVTGADLQAKAGGSFDLVVSIHNDGGLAQAYPTLDVILTNMRNQLVIRRAIAPDDYLRTRGDADARRAAGLAPGGEDTLTIPIRIADDSVVGYTVGIFYP